MLINSIDIHIELGNYLLARELCCQSLLITQELDDRRTLSQSIEKMAWLIDLDGNSQRAVQLISAAHKLRESISALIDPIDQNIHDHWLARIRGNLDQETFDAAWAAGRHMTLQQVITDVLSEE